MSENENKPCKASVLFEQGKIGLVVSAWIMPEAVSSAVLRNPKWDPELQRRHLADLVSSAVLRNPKWDPWDGYNFEIKIEDIKKWQRTPVLGDVIVVRDDSDKKLAYGMVVIGDSPISDLLVVRRTFTGETPGAALLEKLFPGLLCTPTPLHMDDTPTERVSPEIAKPAEPGALPRPAQVMPCAPLPGLPKELGKEHKLVLVAADGTAYPVKVGDSRYIIEDKQFELKLITDSAAGVKRGVFEDNRKIILTSSAGSVGVIFDGRFESVSWMAGDVVFVRINKTPRPWEGPMVTRGLGVGNPNCAAKVTLEDPGTPVPEKPFPKLPSDLELIKAISERVGVLLPSPLAAEETMDHLEKITLRMQTCMETQGPDNVEIAQVWRSRGVCYLVTSLVDRKVGLHALEPTDRAIHGKVEGVVSHVDSIRKKFAWVGSVADAVKKGFIK